MTGRSRTRLLILGTIFMVSVVAGISYGAVPCTTAELFSAAWRPILVLRLVRVVACVIVGSGLAALGAVLQSLFKNPLAEPYLLGTSNGAALGAVGAIILGYSGAAIPLGGCIGTIVTLGLVYAVARRGERIPAEALILAGVIISVAFSAIIVFLVVVMGNETLNGIMWWLWGSLQVTDRRFLAGIGLAVFTGIGVAYFFAQDLNALSLGEETAVHLGVDTAQVQKILFVVTSLITGCLVSLCGMIGFVGLIVPHMARAVVGTDHRVLIPAACLAGGSFMIICDTIGRTILAPTEIPIGVVTALIGTPLFIMILKRSRKGVR